VKLNPKPTEADLFHLIKAITDSFYGLALPDAAPVDKNKKDHAETKPVEVDPNLLHGSQLFETTVESLDKLLIEILNRDMNATGLMNIHKHLEPWMSSMNDHERERSIRSVNSLLKHFSENFKIDMPNQSFQCFGVILGRLVCRSTDPVLKIRRYVTSSIESLLVAVATYNKLEGDKLKEELDSLKIIQVIREKLLKDEPNLMLTAVTGLAKVLCKRIPSDQLVSFIEKLFEGLLDLQSHCSSAACIVLHYCIETRGTELKAQVDNFIRHLYSKLSLIQNAQAKAGSLKAIRTLFKQHLIEALNVVLTFPIPCNNDMIDICKSLSEDAQLVDEIIVHILQIWSRCVPFEERNGVKYTAITPLVGTCLLIELFTHAETQATQDIFDKNFEKIFTAVIIRIASTIDNQMPLPKGKEESEVPQKQDAKSVKASVNADYRKLEPVQISIDCLKSFLKSVKLYELNEYFDKEDLWLKLASDSSCIEAYTILMKGLCLHSTKFIQNIVSNLFLFLSSPYDCQKICVTALLAELLNDRNSLEITELLLNNLLGKLIDPCNTVRTLCIRGLGNISSLGSDEVQKHSTTIMSAMMAGLDDKDDLNDDITLESMDGLSKIIALIDENNVRPILINILLRIRPCIEKDKPSIRSSAIILFGKLARFGQGPSKEPFKEQIHSNFCSFILHLNENDATVKKSCKFTLRQVCPLLYSASLNELFHKALIDDVPLHYGEFINNMSKVLIKDFPDKIDFYIMNSVSNFKSKWSEIRSNAVLFAGYLLGNLEKDKQSVLSKEHITNALIKLLKEDPSPVVRCKAADAISLLHEF